MSILLNRRHLNAGFSVVLTEIIGLPALSSAPPKIVIVGGGAGGATVATHLKQLSPFLEVSLIEQHNKYTSCFFSNPYIGGLYPLHHLVHNYSGVKALGVQVIHKSVKSLDLEKKRIRLEDNSLLLYDRLVLSPGIDFITNLIEGYSDITPLSMPHAWQGKSQTELLRNQLIMMEDGGTFVITIPKVPYRCPPGPYERACLVANFFSKYKPKSKVLILDANMTFTKQKAFTELFENIYKNLIEVYLSNDIDDFTVHRVDPKSKTIFTKSGFQVSAGVANVIPPQKAGRISLENGLGDGAWCPVYCENFLSRKHKDVYILGDSAQADEMPKSAYSAYSQGLQVAAHISAEFEKKPFPKGHYRNICWSIIADQAAIKIGADYVTGAPKAGKERLLPMGAFVSQPGENADVRKAVFDEAIAWYETLTTTIFHKKTHLE